MIRKVKYRYLIFLKKHIIIYKIIKNFKKKNNLLLILLALIILSCSKDDFSINELNQIVNREKTINSIVKFSKINNEKGSYQITRNEFELEPVDYDHLKKILNFNKKSEDVRYFSLYLNNEFNIQNDNLKLDQIKGVSMYIYKEGTYIHELYILKNNKWIRHDKFSGKKSSKIQYSIQSLISNQISNIKSWINIHEYIEDKKMLSKANTIKNQYKASNTGNELERELLNNSSIIPIFDDNGCDWCSGNDKDECRENIGGLMSCKYTCGISKMQEMAQYNNKGTETFSLSELRDFRDNFLSKYPKGIKYIDYYYKISTVTDMLETINFDNYDKNKLLLDEMVIAAKKLQFGNDNDIIVTPKLEKMLNDKINEDITLTTNLEYQTILGTLKKDLLQKTFTKGMNKFKGKTRSEIIKILSVND